MGSRQQESPPLPEIEQLTAQIDEFTRKKDKYVEIADYEKAAEAHEQEEQLKSKRDALWAKRHQPNPTVRPEDVRRALAAMAGVEIGQLDDPKRPCNNNCNIFCR